MPAAAETHQFKAEVNALLRLVTSSLYTNREIFLRELVSNASDALDKARFQALVSEQIRDKGLDPKIEITIDKDRGTLIIEDNGIGMTHEEVIENLGTIAHSGTLQFLERLEAQQQSGSKPDVSLIGQFGVGFYSAFMVAEEIVVDTLSAFDGQEPARWSSHGDGKFALSSSERKTRGTRIELRLKDDAKEFLERFRIEDIIRRYSNYVMHPISLRITGEETATKQINQASAFWTRTPRDLTDDDYLEFYKHILGGFVLPGDEPLGRLHVSMDAPIQFHAVLFVPGRAPADLFLEERKALQLYAKRVLVMESCDKLLPTYLRFFRGVVDSEDLPLNVSREMLQEHRSLAAIRRQLTRKCLNLLSEIAQENRERYAEIWHQFGGVIKEGIHTDNAHREQLTALLRYPTSDGDALSSLDEYFNDMPADQPAIYYITGDPTDDLRKSPHLEACRSRGWSVLLMTDAVDEWVVQDLRTYREKPLRSVTQGDLDVVTDGDAPAADDSAVITAAIAKTKQVLGDKVKDVRPSRRLVESASCLIDDDGGLSRNMQRILRAANRSVPVRPRVLELNPNHGFIRILDTIARERPEDPRLPVWIELLFDQANLAEGEVPDPAGIVKRIQAVLDSVVETPRTTS